MIWVIGPSCSSECAMLISLAEAYFETADWVEIFETGARKEGVTSKVSNNVALKARHIPSLSDTCSTTEISAQDVLFQQLRYHRLTSRYSESNDVEKHQKRKETVQAQEKLPKKVQGGEEVDISQRKKRSGTSQLRRRDDHRGKAEVAVEDRSSSQNGNSAVWYTSEKYRLETFALRQKDIAEGGL